MTTTRFPCSRLYALCLCLMMLGLNLPGCDLRKSDEAILRSEFDIPEQARLIRYEAFPKESGWFGREGLKIDIAFQLDARDYAEYRSRAGVSGQWLPLPNGRLGAPTDSIQAVLRNAGQGHARGGLGL